MIGRYSTVFWDFDGVIKESLTVKSDAFEKLFQPFGVDISLRVREHHERNGGISRYEKIPIYLQWANQNSSAAEVERYSDMFSRAVEQKVIEASWVPGVREYLEANCRQQRFVLLSATPEEELKRIVEAVGLASVFGEVHGSPTRKRDATLDVLRRYNCPASDALVIGDSESDYEAALAAGTDFLLRRTPQNQALQLAFDGPQCSDFVHG